MRGPFERASAELTTLDVSARQTWVLEPPIEGKRFVRVVCTVNAAAAIVRDASPPSAPPRTDADTPTSIGYFSVGFS